MEQKQQNPRLAMWLSLILGLGQFYNKQKAKGTLLLAVFFLELIEIVTFGIPAIHGLITLGDTPVIDHSLFLLIKGAMQLILFLVMIIVHIICMRDAKKTAEMLNQGMKVPMTAKETLQTIYENGFPYLLTIPAYLAMTFAIVFPVLVTIFIAFTNYDFRHIPPQKLLDWVGFKNFVNMVELSTFRSAFSSVLSWTFIWTLAASTLQIVVGVATAIIANQPFIKFKRVFGVIFLLPWAVPAFISIMSFGNFFNDSIGAMNVQVLPFIEKILPFLDFGIVPWKTDPTWTKIAVVMVQGWLGFPYIYILVSGILQSIPSDLYEAAIIDGASAWQKFWKITLPMILAVAAPTFISQYTFNFNNFSIIYLFNNGGPGSVGGGAGSTDILISWIYKLTTQTSPQFSMASAVTLIISLIVISVSLITFKKFNAFDMEDR
ncbi:arabinogalactan oligomer/maltooligosaccharide transport system permease protein [Streptococcus gallinaceus]|uniref:carbohydrate ABC transporter permease n=1 Tax=Streptococcus gallinaceus TaxID=165758 RepID=UPI0020A0DCA8|nr:sugar ABC transporter permease [Streptococcus gallinaceus]MCP1639487.1 arabinogalactan oligomer/maltooligosaccharide transport system permease protein [Streptococcus gallinaceus]MCP1770270.1 arabinogalactan oligomer/maltooligosaccharide transport system permease protein [Streptococcus gallinaceus]